MTTIFDVGVIGAGPAGIFAAYKIAKDHPKTSAILFDLGRPCGKRRRPGEGYFGMFPNSDGKLYTNDINDLADVSGSVKTKNANKWFMSSAKNVIDCNIVKDRSPSDALTRKIKKQGYSVNTNNHIQLYPKEIHALSRYTSDTLNSSKNITCSFDNEIFNIVKHKNVFHISSHLGEFVCKKIIACVGRGGWRWAQELFESFGIVEENNITKFGIRVEITSSSLKDFNTSNCFIANKDLELGPFSWHGTVVPEDHIDFAISGFRGNEERWETDKTSFNLIGNRVFPNKGFEQTNRIGQLTFILSNDRILKEKISTILNGKSRLSLLPEYDWLPEAINKVAQFVP